ncbi:MAG TPA: aminotransferase class V-fold PLP-dependent enzyme [Candidatus Egerieimonas faecigallinarum]|nr:aminotransferase class V-fold PLP-dependent enzyme [Candidatus Egerieimonas faecigallinarum]
MIYLDAAATGLLKPPEVAAAVADAICRMGNDSRGIYPASLYAGRVLLEARERLAELFGAEGADCVAFAVNGTQALNTAVKGILNPGDRAVTTVLEHNSVLRPLYEMEERGIQLTVIGCREPAAPGGALDLDAMERAIVPGVRAVFCTHASNLTGNSVDIRRIGEKCRENGVLFVVDACQSAGSLPIHMERDHIDILCFTGHKGLMGPQGTGGICVRRGIKIRPLLTGGSGIQTYSRTHPEQMPAALEAGTLNGHGIAGLTAALREIMRISVSEIGSRKERLCRLFVQEAAKIPGIRLYGDYSQPVRTATAALNLGEEDSGFVSAWLAQEKEICTRSGGHCAPLMHEALGTREQGAVRFSFSYYNTEEEVLKAVSALRELSELCGYGRENMK